MKLSPQESLSPEIGLIVLALVVIVSGLVARIPNLRDPGIPFDRNDGNCVYQVIDENGCIGTISMSDSHVVRDILFAVGVSDALRCGSPDQRIPCGSRIRMTGNSPDVSIEKLPGADLVAMGKRIDINRADQKDLAAIPGIGPNLAARIIDQRDSRGSSKPGHQVWKIPGIGTKKRGSLEMYTESEAAVPPENPKKRLENQIR